MKIINIIFFYLITLIKFIESCMRVTDCQWNDPCNNYKLYKECLSHKECTMGKPEDSGGELFIDIGDDDEIFNDPNQNPPIPPPLACVSKDIKQCYINIRCSIF